MCLESDPAEPFPPHFVHPAHQVCAGARGPCYLDLRDDGIVFLENEKDAEWSPAESVSATSEEPAVVRMASTLRSRRPLVGKNSRPTFIPR